MLIKKRKWNDPVFTRYETNAFLFFMIISDNRFSNKIIECWLALDRKIEFSQNSYTIIINFFKKSTIIKKKLKRLFISFYQKDNIIV